MLSSPKRRAIWSDQRASPKGQPRSTDRRSAANSASACGALTSCTQFAKRRRGQAAKSSLPLLSRHQWRLPQRQSSALDQVGTQSVALHVAANREEMRVVLNGERLEAALIQVPAAGTVAVRVPALRMSQGKPPRESRQLAVFPRPEHHVPVRRQHTVRQQPRFRPLHGRFQNLFERGIIVRFVEDPDARIGAVKNVIHQSAIGCSFRSSHTESILKTTPACQENRSRHQAPPGTSPARFLVPQVGWRQFDAHSVPAPRSFQTHNTVPDTFYSFIPPVTRSWMPTPSGIAAALVDRERIGLGHSRKSASSTMRLRALPDSSRAKASLILNLMIQAEFFPGELVFFSDCGDNGRLGNRVPSHRPVIRVLFMSKKVGFSAAVLFLGVIGMIAFTASPAVAHKEFKDTFKAKYVKPDSTAVNDVALAKAFDEASCTVCHAGGDDKKIRNDYGKQLALRLKDEDTKDAAQPAGSDFEY